MADWIIEQTVEMTRPTQPYTSRPVELMLPGDHLAHTWRIKCLERGLPADLTGFTASGYFKRMDGNYVLITGSISSNTVIVTLTQECYAYPGSLRGVVRIANADTDAVVTLADRLFFVQSAVDDGGTVDPGEVIPSLADLLAEIDAMETATAAAEAAATKAVRYDSAQSLTDAQKEQARSNIDAASDDDVDDLKSAVTAIDDEAKGIKNLLQTKESANLFPQIAEEDYVVGYKLEGGELVDADTCAYLATYIPVEGETEYTMAIVPPFGSANTPWHNYRPAGAFYDKDKHYIGDIPFNTTGTIDTPISARYIRVNCASGSGLSRGYINERCMLVKGSEPPETYVPYDGQDQYISADIIEEQIGGINAKADEVQSLLDERTLYLSENLYNPALQTSETISPHYYVEGVPYSSTQFDSAYHCTALIPVKPNTQYTIGLIPGFTYNSNTYTVPWGTLAQKLFYYDADGEYINKLSDSGGTFTTPSNAKYIRFNYFITGLGLTNLNNTCVIVYGDTLPEVYTPYSVKTIKEEVARVDEKTDGFAADIAEVTEAEGETAEVVDLLLGNHEIIRSANKYDRSLQTSDTISPHYYVNGVPYSTTQFDGAWNCTAMFEIEPNTEYTIGLVPAVENGDNDIVKPWHTASYGIFFYDASQNYISGTATNTFTTPANAKYARFNYYISAGIVSLSVLNARCMLVKGATLPETYQEFGDKLESDLQDQIASIDVGFEWKFSGSDLLLSYGYNQTHDAVIVLNNGRANGLFDFAKLALKPVGTPLSSLETSDLAAVWSSGTDMHGPFQFNAIDNPDGYKSDATSPGFVGGNHTLDQLGSDFKTAASKYVQFFADGRPVSSGYGKATHFEIRWANDVQAYNTVKEGGGGRACLTEFHDMIFDGVQFNEVVKLVPLEDIDMHLWYGFQFVSWGNAYTNIRFLDGTNRGVYLSTGGNATSGNRVTRGMEAWGDDHKVVLTVDNEFDLGKRELVPSNNTEGAFTSNSKGYFRIISQSTTMYEGDAYYLAGSFRFNPAIVVE